MKTITDYKDSLISVRELIMGMLDFMEREASHRPPTNVIVADYADLNPHTLLQPARYLVEGRVDLKRSDLIRTLSGVEDIMGLPVTTARLLKRNKRTNRDKSL